MLTCSRRWQQKGGKGKGGGSSSSSASTTTTASSEPESIRAGPDGEGAYVTVHAKPGSRVAGVTGIAADAVSIAIDAEAREGKANAAMSEFLAEVLGLRARDVTLCQGAKGRHKTFVVHRLSADEVRARLQAALEEHQQR